jgi:hypothetical protein
VYTTERPFARPVTVAPASLDAADSLVKPMGLSPSLDPTLLQVAQYVYRTFFEVHPDYPQKPTGVVVNQISLRAQLIFKDRPILLIQECFIPLNQIES